MAFTNSPLVSKTILSKNYNPRKYPITKITIHHAAGFMPMEELLAFCANPGRDMSANYVLSGGKLGLCVEEKNRAWTSSNRENDHKAVTIEVANSSGAPNWPISDLDLSVLIKWCADVCIRNNIPKLYYDSTPDGSLTLHEMFTQTACPGPYIKSKIDYICTEVNKLIKAPNDLYSGDKSALINAFDYAQTGFYTDVTPDYKEINNYVITLDRNSPTVNYDKLKEIGVIAVLIEEGDLYNVVHKENEVYVNPKLDSQVSAAIKNNMMFGFYTTVRAQSVDEANRELRMLRLYAAKYTPPFGIWLTLNMTKSKLINDKIIERYKDALEFAGFHGKMGFYVTRQQLNSITWSKWKEHFLLLLVDHISNISEIETILTPEFFMLEKK